MKLGERLIAHQLVSEEEVTKALDIQRQAGGRLGAILVRMGALSEDVLLCQLVEHLELKR